MRGLLVSALLVALAAGAAEAQSLRGSPTSLDRQNRQARAHDFTYLSTTAQVSKFVRLGLLVRLNGNADYELAAVSFPYAREEVKVFLERLSRQYRAACGERLVVTSLTRPQNRQPRNASPRSVHPTGMAVDLRISNNARCRSWLESVLLQLEKKRLVEATRERRPPHYHVAVYPQPYRSYVAGLVRGEAATRVASAAAESGADAAPAIALVESGGRTESELPRYTVDTGDTLWGIARELGLSVEDLKDANGLASARIYAGQVLTLPQR